MSECHPGQLQYIRLHIFTHITYIYIIVGNVKHIYLFNAANIQEIYSSLTLDDFLIAHYVPSVPTIDEIYQGCVQIRQYIKINRTL